ncbi:MAG TPA: sugar phosphate isomerase/epimerase family protein [Chloroflexota bacterium]|nr:sugar phosphate isomerase/epimerase family protein [Chloroflexota bacterium]
MRYGLCTGDPLILRQLSEWGYDYAEIGARTLLPFDDEATFAPQRAALRQAGMSIEAMAGFIPESVPVIGSEVDWARVREYLTTTLGRAAEVGVKVVNWGSVQSRRVPPGWPMSRAWEQIERAASLIAEIAQPLGIVIAIESVNPLEANVLFYLPEAANLVATVGAPNLRLNLDYYHCLKQNEPTAHLEAVAPLIVHTHTSDDGRRFPLLGAWDQRPFLEFLERIGYRGRLSFEVRDPGPRSFAEAAELSVRRMRELERVVATEA